MLLALAVIEGLKYFQRWIFPSVPWNNWVLVQNAKKSQTFFPILKMPFVLLIIIVNVQSWRAQEKIPSGVDVKVSNLKMMPNAQALYHIPQNRRLVLIY